MNLYTIVTADEYELPIACDIRVKQAAEYLGVTTGNIRQLVFHGRKHNGYKVVVSGKVKFNKKEYQKRYDMTHDRSDYKREYGKEYYRRKKRERSGHD